MLTEDDLKEARHLLQKAQAAANEHAPPCNFCDFYDGTYCTFALVSKPVARGDKVVQDLVKAKRARSEERFCGPKGRYFLKSDRRISPDFWKELGGKTVVTLAILLFAIFLIGPGVAACIWSLDFLWIYFGYLGICVLGGIVSG